MTDEELKEDILEMINSMHIKVELKSDEEYQTILKYYEDMGKQTIFCGPSTEKESS